MTEEWDCYDQREHNNQAQVHRSFLGKGLEKNAPYAHNTIHKKQTCQTSQHPRIKEHRTTEPLAAKAVQFCHHGRADQTQICKQCQRRSCLRKMTRSVDFSVISSHLKKHFMTIQCKNSGSTLKTTSRDTKLCAQEKNWFFSIMTMTINL